MWDLVPWPGIEPSPLHWEHSVNHWTTREVPCCCSVAKSYLTLCDPMNRSMPGLPVLHHLPQFAQTHVHWVDDVSSHLVLCRPLLLPPSIFPSIRVFSNESALYIRWSKCWSFSICPANEYSGLISFRIYWFHLFAVQGTLKSPLHHHSSKASILRCSAFFMVQPSHPYVTTGKAIDLTIQTSVHKVMSLLIITLFMLVIALSQYILLTAFHLQVSSSVRWRPGPFCHCLPIIKICWVH